MFTKVNTNQAKQLDPLEMLQAAKWSLGLLRGEYLSQKLQMEASLKNRLPVLSRC